MAIIHGPILVTSVLPSGSVHITGGGAASIDPTDVNDPKDLDKVVVTGMGGKTSVFGSDSELLVLEYGDPIVIDVGDGLAEQITGDLDGNGWDDLVVADPVANTLDVLLQSDDSVFASPVQLPLLGQNPQSITTIDLDSDGDLDLVVVLENESGVRVAKAFRNDTEYSGGVATFTDVGYEQGGGDFPMLARSADVDADGADDLWLATETPPSFAGDAIGSTNTVLNTIDLGTPCPGDFNGDGEVAVADILILIAAWGTGPSEADLDGDNDVDVADLLLLIAAWGACPS